jgi:large subunit ribosomal protein L24
MAKKVLANKRIRKGDTVVVISGNDKGRTGEVLQRQGDKVLVKGINVRKKHLKRSETNPNGIVDIEVPIHASKLMLCVSEDKGVRSFVRVNESGEKELCYRLDGQEQVHRNLKKQ